MRQQLARTSGKANYYESTMAWAHLLDQPWRHGSFNVKAKNKWSMRLVMETAVHPLLGSRRTHLQCLANLTFCRRLLRSWHWMRRSDLVSFMRPREGKCICHCQLFEYDSHTHTGRGTSGSFNIPAEKDDKRQAFDLRTFDGFSLERWRVAAVPLYLVDNAV